MNRLVMVRMSVQRVLIRIACMCIYITMTKVSRLCLVTSTGNQILHTQHCFPGTVTLVSLECVHRFRL